MFGFGRRADKEAENDSQDNAMAGPNAPKSKGKKGILHRLGWYADAGIILALGVGGFVLLQLLAPQPQISDAPDRTPYVTVLTAEVRSGPVMVKGFGVVRSRAEIGLAAQVPGQVVYVSPNFEVGGEFKKGDVLVQIDPRVYEANLVQAEANRDAGKANLAFAESQVRRNKNLAQQGFTAKQRFDELVAKRDEAKANMARLNALVDQAQLDLEHATITAPFDGRVRTESVDQGTYLSIGSQIGQIFATDAVEVSVPLSDQEAALLPDLWHGETADTKLKATLTARFGGEKYRWDGYVHRAAANIDTGTRTLNVVVRVDNPFQPGTPLAETADGNRTVSTAPPLLVGMYATVEMEGKTLDRFVVLPREALRDDDTIWIVDAKNTLRIRPVDVVQKRGDEVTIVSENVSGTTRVVTSALSVVVDGMSVRILDRSQDPQTVSQMNGASGSLTR